MFLHSITVTVMITTSILSGLFWSPDQNQQIHDMKYLGTWKYLYVVNDEGIRTCCQFFTF